MVGSVASSGIVYEAITEDNYESWSALMKNYLLGEGLWDVVTGEIDDASESWRRRNAKALHAIQLSCGPDVLNLIRKISHARDAWNRLTMLFSPILKDNPDIEQGNNLLYRCVERGDWNAARCIIMSDGNSVFDNSSYGKTILHVAVLAGREDIVQKLVSTYNDRLLEIQDSDGYTALDLVAQLDGNMKMAECMVEKNRNLLTMEAKDKNHKIIPLVLAAAKGHKKLTRYLYSKTPDWVLTQHDSRQGVMLLINCITTEIFDVALKLLNRHPTMPLTSIPPECHSRWLPLYALANMPTVFPSGCPFNWWQCIIYRILRPQYQDPHGWISIKIVSNAQQEKWQERKPSAVGRFWQKASNIWWVKVLGQWLRRVQTAIQDTVLLKISVIKEVYDKKLTHYLVLQIRNRFHDRVLDFDESQLRDASAYDAMLQAAKGGIIEFIDSMRKANPTLLWVIDKNKRGVFAHVILNRREKVFQLLKEIEEQTKTITSRDDAFGNNMLHLAAELGPSSNFGGKSGAALQMQKEIQWFKAVEKIAHPRCKEAKNADGKKPHEVFTRSHEGMVKAGEKWAKDTTTSFTIVCTLIITIMFAAAFTVPGGNNQETGFPIFLNRNLFRVFIVADALSLVSSTSSVLIFIGILTSRYAENDFLRILPLKLLGGLFFLFLSVVAMMLAFCAAIAMMLKGHRSVVIAAIVLACVPVILFVPTQLPLFIEIFESTVGFHVFKYIFLVPYNAVICMIKIFKACLFFGFGVIARMANLAAKFCGCAANRRL